MNRRPQQLDRELRDGTDTLLDHRRAVSASAVVSMTSLAAAALYRLNLPERLPEPGLPGSDAQKVNGLAGVYQLRKTPDAAMGLGNYAGTLGLAAMGGAVRARTQPWTPLSMAAKAGLNTMRAAALTRKSWVNYRAFSLSSLVTATAPFRTLPSVLSEALAARRNLVRR